MDYFIKVLKSYAIYTGRARRAEYWYFVLFNVIINFIIGFIAGLIGAPIISTIIALLFIIPGIAVAVRRMHDVGKSGWYALIPIYNLILACTEGEKGDNQYGPDPKAATEALKVS
jgi:uncharacterized membrane protein YhaH (DUF805 family)